MARLGKTPEIAGRTESIVLDTAFRPKVNDRGYGHKVQIYFPCPRLRQPSGPVPIAVVWLAEYDGLSN